MEIEKYVTVDPQLPCNGCNRLGKAGIITRGRWERVYTLDITCRDCAIYLSNVYSGKAAFGEGYNEPVEVPDYDNDVRISDTLGCLVCGEATDRAIVMRTDTQLPHNFKLYPYCHAHKKSVRQQVG